MSEANKKKRTKRRQSSPAPELEPVLASSHPLTGERSKFLRNLFWLMFAVLGAIVIYGVFSTLN